MARLSVDEAARAMNGRIAQGDPQAVCSGAAIDSRKVNGGVNGLADRKQYLGKTKALLT